LRDIVNFSKEYSPSIIARIKVLANLKLDEHRLPQDGRFKLEINKKRYSFRVSVMPVIDGEKVVIRILEEEGKEFTLEDLGFIEK
jgi:type IV pilus assembly protein PilB